MDIQSSTLADFFELFPVFVPGWVSPVKPPALANGGIPRSLYDDKPTGLQVVIDPLSELQSRGQIMAAYDSVAVFFNDDATSVASTTIQPGDEQKRISLDAKKGKLKHGLNRIYYKVTRLSGNVETSRDLLVLYHLRAPDNLALVIPADVVANGVSAARAAQGVVFGFTYTTLQSYDEMSFHIGNETFTREVTDPPSPLTITLSTADFQKIGDGNVKLEFVVTDQLGNSAISGVQTLNIHVSTLELQAPTVIGQSGNNFSPTQPQIRVVVPAGSLLPTDQLTVQWTGSTTAAEGSYTSPSRAVSAGLEIAVPRSVLAYNLSSPVTVKYTATRDGVSTTSPPLKLNILPLPASALIPPKIIDADANNVLDVNALGTKDATIHGLLWTLIEAGQQVWLWLEGKKADGSAHNLTVWNGGGSKVNTTWVSQGFWPRTFANSYLKQLADGSTLTLHFAAALDKSNIKDNAVVFPLRTYTIRSVALVAPTITSVKGTINTSEIANGASTYEKKIVLTGAASPNALVEIYDGSVRKGQITVNASGVWTQTVSELSAGLHSFTVKAVYGSGAVSAQRKLTVQVVLSENFDSYPSRTITAGGQITLPSMTIAFSGGSGSLGITALSSIKPTHGGPFSAIANRSSGQILEMHVDASGTSQDMRINFNWGYSAVSCYCRFAQFSDISVYFYNQTNQQIQHKYLLNQAAPQLVSCTSSENNIWSMRIVTKRMDLIAFDFFTMQRR